MPSVPAPLLMAMPLRREPASPVRPLPHRTCCSRPVDALRLTVQEVVRLAHPFVDIDLGLELHGDLHLLDTHAL